MQLQVRERQSQAGNAAVRVHLERRLKIVDGCLCVLHVIAHVTAVHHRFKHFGIFFERAGEIIDGLLQQLVLPVHVPREQREIRFFGQNAFIAAHQRQNVVITAQVVIS